MPEPALIARLIAAASLFAALVVQPLAAADMVAPMNKGDRIAGTIAQPQASGSFHALFMSWKKLDTTAVPGAISVPSALPVANATYSSGFGVRSDPFHGGAAMHAGIDLAAPAGTPIYATADGTVDRAEWFGGYGNMVEIDHGKGLQTRFGHLSRMLVQPGAHVRRGTLIGLMGSTGRSTGSHLHYEVRIDGRAVNPVPFLQSADYATAMQARTAAGIAMGGPDDANADAD